MDEVISTRRLVAIAETFAIFKDRVKAVQLGVSRFDDDTKESFLDLYTKIADETLTVPETTEELPSDYASDEDAPF